MKSGIVAIIGRPNAGKSTLLNRLLDQSLSIVTPKAQTTRDQLRGILNTSQGQIVFIDTPGVHQARTGSVNEYMVKEAERALEEPDLVWYLVDPDSKLARERLVLELLRKTKSKVILIFNKCDRKEVPTFKEEFSEIIEDLGLNLLVPHPVEISALKGQGVQQLMDLTWNALPEGPALYPDDEALSDRPLRYFVAEIVREQLYRCLGEELPYSCAVEIKEFKEEIKPIRVEAVIYVERDSQKGMVIGSRGAKIKEIGQKARKKAEELLGEKMFLGLNVKVLKNWTQDAGNLRKLGYDIGVRKP